MDTLRYEVVADWEQLPDGYTHLDVVGVAVDSRDRLFLLGRQQPRVLIYERDGTFVGSWGEGMFTERTHGLTIAPDDSVFIVDEGEQVVYKFTPDGELLLTLGNKGVASDTGYDGQSLESIVRGGPPFNRPTNVAVAPSGELYVSDGYGNARVHRFSAAGELLGSWGEPGNGPGQFNLSHGVAVAPDGRVFVADRENDRIQIFTPEGAYLTEWRQVQRPTNVAFGADGRVYVSELWRRAGETSMLHGLIPDDHPAAPACSTSMAMSSRGGAVPIAARPEVSSRRTIFASIRTAISTSVKSPGRSGLSRGTSPPTATRCRSSGASISRYPPQRTAVSATLPPCTCRSRHNFR